MEKRIPLLFVPAVALIGLLAPDQAEAQFCPPTICIAAIRAAPFVLNYGINQVQGNGAIASQAGRQIIIQQAPRILNYMGGQFRYESTPQYVPQQNTFIQRVPRAINNLGGEFRYESTPAYQPRWGFQQRPAPSQNNNSARPYQPSWGFAPD